MSGQRLDRAELRHRLPDVPAWIVDEFADAFEPALMAAMKLVADRKRPPVDDKPPSRKRRGRGPEREPA